MGKLILTEELITKLVGRARQSADNAYCPYTKSPVGCSLLVNNNVIFGGCNIENSILSCSAEAGEVAVYKAISEDCTGFLAICFWADVTLPYPSGKIRQLLSEFNPEIHVIVASGSVPYKVFNLKDLIPFPPEVTVDE